MEQLSSLSFVLMIPVNFIEIVKDGTAGFYGFLLVCICTVRSRSYAIRWNTELLISPC